MNVWNSTNAKIEKYQRELLIHMQERYKSNQLTEGSFAKIFMDFAVQEKLTEEEMLSEIFIFLVAGKFPLR